MLIDRSDSRSVAVVLQHVERMAKSERGFQRGRVCVKATLPRVGLPCDGPEAIEVSPMLAPEPGTPFPKIEVPEGVVDAGRFPIEDARELTADNKQLVLMDVAMDE